MKINKNQTFSYASLLYSTRDKNVIDIPCPDLDIDAVPYVGAGAQLD